MLKLNINHAKTSQFTEQDTGHGKGFRGPGAITSESAEIEIQGPSCGTGELWCPGESVIYLLFVAAMVHCVNQPINHY